MLSRVCGLEHGRMCSDCGHKVSSVPDGKVLRCFVVLATQFCGYIKKILYTFIVLNVLCVYMLYVYRCVIVCTCACMPARSQPMCLMSPCGFETGSQ